MPIIDPHGREIRYLRLSVTDKCNFRCRYCRSDGKTTRLNDSERLTIAETLRLVKAFVSLGVERVRLTGGEPLLRPRIMDLVNGLGAIDALEEVSLSTNAYLLEKKALPLKEAGIRRVNISLDSLDPDRFNDITQGGDLIQVLRGIDAALSVGLNPVKINMVVMGGINDDEIPAMVRFARERNVLLRFIETMPIGEDGRAIMGHHVPMKAICERIQKVFGGDVDFMKDFTCNSLSKKGKTAGDQREGGGPARYVHMKGLGIDIGLISAVSRHFCDTCNRVRLTAFGQLVLCLGKDGEVDLRTPLRSGLSDEALQACVLDAIAKKPLRHDFDRYQEMAPMHRMSSLGG
ncbi:MAG: GTP 3',8-cyclase MoaA [Magnetococcales bacterium]|nr:GTP 3',8-cyclase MoaA [Magnetococcales bacterium]